MVAIGAVELYRDNYVEEALITFPEIGVISLSEALDAIRQETAAGRRWAEVEFEDARVISLTLGAAVLLYVATARWEHEPTQAGTMRPLFLCAVRTAGRQRTIISHRPGEVCRRFSRTSGRCRLEVEMHRLSSFPITGRWPPTRPDILQLYSVPSPNGVKVSIMLEEIGLPYEAHRVELGDDEQNTPEYLSLNPYGKIPAIVDPDGPDGAPMGLFESGAILIYLAEKTGLFLPTNGRARAETLQWLMFQMGGIGPMFGQLGYFHKFKGREIADKRPLEHYRQECKRLLAALEGQLAEHEWIAGAQYTIADIATLGWVRNLISYYEARELVEFDALHHTPAWLARCVARPAVARGLTVAGRTTP